MPDFVVDSRDLLPILAGLAAAGIGGAALWFFAIREAGGEGTGCDLLEAQADALDRAGIPLASGMSCVDLQALATCGGPHATEAQQAFNQFCAGG